MTTTQTQALRQIARAFTRPVFAEMARTGSADGAMRYLSGDTSQQAAEADHFSLAAVFERQWEQLAAHYRNEYVYKNELATRLIFKRHSPRTAGFLVELGIGKSIVDVAVANGTSTAYEIKTEFDSSKRLTSQTADYLKAFDQVYVVTHPNHVERYERELDERVGLIVLSPTKSLTPYRKALSNSQNIEARTIFQCLRRAEYLDAISKYFGPVPELPNGVIATYCENLFLELPKDITHQIFVQALQARTTDKNTVDFVKILPSSLRALGYATPLSIRQREVLAKLLSRPVKT